MTSIILLRNPHSDSRPNSRPMIVHTIMRQISRSSAIRINLKLHETVMRTNVHSSRRSCASRVNLEWRRDADTGSECVGAGFLCSYSEGVDADCEVAGHAVSVCEVDVDGEFLVVVSCGDRLFVRRTGVWRSRWYLVGLLHVPLERVGQQYCSVEFEPRCRCYYYRYWAATGRKCCKEQPEDGLETIIVVWLVRDPAGSCFSCS